MKSRFSAAIVGVTGYTGSELLRLLRLHSEVSLTMVTSESRKGEKLRDCYPHFHECPDIVVSSMDDVPGHDPDMVFLALPHGVSMKFMEKYGEKCRKIIDLSGDFRLGEKNLYEKWYKMKHICPRFMDEAVYGMPEFFREEIKEARFVANPGCFPTSVIIPLVPLLKHGVIDESSIIADAKTGVSGAGAKPKKGTHFPDVFGNFSAYKLLFHRHTPEMETILEQISGKTPSVLFTPHLLPVDRGILSTIYADVSAPVNKNEFKEIYEEAFCDEPFIRLSVTPPSLKNVRGSNYVDIYHEYDERTGRIILLSAIDNLVKGAAGAAVQNMNIMLGCGETEGLTAFPLNP